MAIVFDDEQIKKPKIVFDDEVQAQPSLMGQVGNITSQYEKSQFGSPSQLLQSVPSYLSAGFGKLGEMATEQLSTPQNRVNPYVAAGVGTVIAMAPDVAMAGINPTPNTTPNPEVNPLFKKAAVPLARRALGFSKRFLNTPFSRGQAQKAAEVALESNVIPLSGSPEAMMNKVKGLKESAGQEIGSVFKSTPADLSKTFDDLEVFRQKITKGFGREGSFAPVHNAIDTVQTDLAELAGKGGEVTVESLNAIKKRLADSINYLGDLASQSDKKGIAGTLANSIRSIVKTVQSPEVYSKFLNNQKLYNAYSLMVKGLNNEIAGQMGNRLFSPYAVIAATGKAVSGSPAKAISTLGLTEGALRRSAGTTAKALFEAGKVVPPLGKVTPGLVANTALAVDRKTNENKIKELGKSDVQKYINMAKQMLPNSKDKNAIRTKARELAAKAGFTWKGKK